MTITVGETTAEVVVKAYTTLRVADVTATVRDRAVGIDEATVHWRFRGGQWHIEFIQLAGRFLNADGKPSRRAFQGASYPADTPGRRNRTVTPPQIVAAAHALVPDWTPVPGDIPYRFKTPEDAP